MFNLNLWIRKRKHYALTARINIVLIPEHNKSLSSSCAFQRREIEETSQAEPTPRTIASDNLMERVLHVRGLLRLFKIKLGPRIKLWRGFRKIWHMMRMWWKGSRNALSEYERDRLNTRGLLHNNYLYWLYCLLNLNFDSMSDGN